MVNEPKNQLRITLKGGIIAYTIHQLDGTHDYSDFVDATVEYRQIRIWTRHAMQNSN